ncbi:MAG: DUF5050 domain-containing protein [Candidatus Limiplasma sp.]|nr:DUF5050 domain-containing protein [Candidatus Limiplasma sp.]
MICAMAVTDSPYLGGLAETALGSAAESGAAATAPTEAELLPPDKVLEIGGWVYYASEYTLYRMKADGSDQETLFKADWGVIRSNGIHSLAQCGDYLLFTHAAYIYKMDLNTLETTALVQSANESAGFLFAVNGNSVYFVETESGFMGAESGYIDGLYQTDINGTNPRQITPLPLGFFWRMQLYGEEIYLSQQHGPLYRIPLDGSKASPVPNSLGIHASDFVVYEDYIFGRTPYGTLFRSDGNGDHCILISQECASFIIAGGKVMYSESSGGIFLCDLDGGNQKAVFQGFADIWASRGNQMLINIKEGGPQLREITVLGDKADMAKMGGAWAGSTVASVTSAEEFIAAVGNDQIETIQIASSITLDGPYGLYSSDKKLLPSRNKHTLTINEGASLTVNDLNFMLSGCQVIVHGELIVAGRIMSYEVAPFSGDGTITYRDRGMIECLIRETKPTTQELNALLSQDSPYTDIFLNLSVGNEPELVLTEDLEIPKGKTLRIVGHILTVPQGVTLTNNGTLLLPELNVEGKYEGGGALSEQGKR